MVTVTSASQNHIFDDAKIIVIKVGSSLLVDEDQNAINTAWLSGIATDIARLKAAGCCGGVKRGYRTWAAFAENEP